MTVELVQAAFAGRIGETFRAVPTFAGGPLELVLSECDAAEAPHDAGRVPFSLTFLAPTADPLPQQIFDLTNAELGTLQLFLVPLGPDEQRRMRYEAVVN